MRGRRIEREGVQVSIHLHLWDFSMYIRPMLTFPREANQTGLEGMHSNINSVSLLHVCVRACVCVCESTCVRTDHLLRTLASCPEAPRALCQLPGPSSAQSRRNSYLASHRETNTGTTSSGETTQSARSDKGCLFKLSTVY